ncbi:MAG: ribonuclease P protein component [Gallionella sp.]
MPRDVQDSRSSIAAEFTHEYRLLRKDNFDRVLQAELITGECYRIFFALNVKRNARLGIIASKRMFPRAVDRNRVKREIREAFRQHSIKTQRIDVVVLVRRADLLKLAVKSDDLEKLFSQVGSLCASSLSS